ncbi:MAG: short-chain dehydrogenase [Oceanospirillaceae bacterium]|nr:short-chain dehydrogenase [Oceanospirillaceae bacterium]MBT10610.1 short-chain dehydrogenase [Oceanospirillaceae bacterium]|tara:strand:- start:4569 stop:5468 length:900 start_codon:yes stop_codon:yes gene_type:complete
MTDTGSDTNKHKASDAENSTDKKGTAKAPPLARQVIWLTGASSGIGAALAKRLPTLCQHVFITARNQQTLNELQNGHNNVTVLAADVTDPAGLKNAADSIYQQFGRLDTLIANAGTCEYLDVQAFDGAMVQRVVQTNFFGLVNTVEAALPLLRQSQRGYIAGMSSSVTALAMPRAEAYGASKAATLHFLQSLKADLSASQIDVSAISPGFVKTPLTDVNDFPMPALIPVEQAAEEIIKGLRKRRFDIHFPKRFTRILRLTGLLPDWIRFRLTAAMARSDSQPRSSHSPQHKQPSGESGQ